MPNPLSQGLNPDPGTPCLPWDRFCDLLGESDWETPPETIRLFPPFRNKFSVGRQFLFQDDPARLPLESFWLKLSGFATLCRQVAEFYQRNQRPYLSLEPRNIRVYVKEQTFTWLPARWSFALDLDDAMGASVLVHDTMPKGMAREIFVPAGDLDSAYAAPVMTEWPMGRELSVTALLRSVERIPDETNDQASRALVRAHVFTEAVSLTDFSDHDALNIVLTVGERGRGVVPLWGRRVEAAERGLVVSGVTDSMSNETWAQLEQAKQQVFSDAQAIVYRAFHHTCDLYSLGMLLFRSLLVTKGRPMEQVRRQIEGLRGRLEPLVQGLDPQDHWTLFMRMTQRLKEEGGVFEPLSDFPEYLWYEALIVGLRLVSQIPGFSLCAGVEVADEAAVPEAVQAAVRAAELLAEQARVELFETAGRHRELMNVCDRVPTESM